MSTRRQINNQTISTLGTKVVPHVNTAGEEKKEVIFILHPYK